MPRFAGLFCLQQNINFVFVIFLIYVYSVKTNNLLLFGGLGALALLLMSNAANAYAVNLSSLNGRFAASDIQRLENVKDALVRKGLTALQIRLMLAQILHETGLFTQSNANYRAMDNLNNYAGISPGGTLAHYNNLDEFATDYIRVLSKAPNYPIQAVNVDDFNDRLKSNGYYTDSKTTYGNALHLYYNLLS